MTTSHHNAAQPNMQMPLLPDEDMAYTILADLKRVTREYATAAMESVCPSIRQMFSQLLNNTLRMQGELYTAMQELNMYNASSPALRPEIDKQLKQYRQTQHKTGQLIRERSGLMQPGAVRLDMMQQDSMQPVQ